MAWNDVDDKPSGGDDWRSLEGEKRQVIRSEGWQRLDAVGDDEGKQPWSRGTKLAIVGLALAVVMIVAAVVIPWLKSPRPACLLLVGAPYDTNLLMPPNTLGWKGLADIEGWAPEDAMGERWALWRSYKRMRRVGSLSQHTLSRDKPWAQLKENVPELRGIASGKEDTLVVFMSLLGTTDAEGNPILLADDAHGKTAVTVQTILDDLKGFQTAEDPAKAKKKSVVLLLDAVPAENHWSLGIFGNDFISGVKKLTVPANTYVICSCAENQRSWTSEEWQRSIFAHYVLMGLRGAAAQSNPQKVTLGELFDYLEKRVNSWALGNRDVEQTPVFLGNREAAQNVDIVRVEETFVEEGPEAAPGKEFKGLSDQLKAEWKAWQDLKSGGGWVHAPQLWRQYQDALLRWEHLERAGCGSDRWGPLQNLTRVNGAALRNAQKLKFADGCLSTSVPLARATGRPGEGAAQGTPQRLWALWEEHGADIKSLNGDKRWQEAKAAWAKALKDDRDAPAAVYARLTSALFDALLDEANNKNFGRPDLQRAADFIKHFTRDDHVRPIEAHFLVMLNQRALANAPTDLLREALRVRRLAEQAAVSVSGAESRLAEAPTYSEFIFPLILARFKAADKKRHDGEDYLLGGENDFKMAAKLLRAAADDFAEIQRGTEALRAAMATRDRAWADLPYLAQWLARHPISTDPATKAVVGKKELDRGSKMLSEGLDSLARLTRELDKLAQATDDEPLRADRLETLQELTASVEGRRSDLSRDFESLSNVSKIEDQLLYHRAESILSVPGLPAKRREELIRQSRQISAKLNTDMTEHKADVKRRMISFEEPARQEQHARQCYGPALSGDKERLFDALAKAPEKIETGRKQSLEQANLVKAKALLQGAVALCRVVPGGRVPDEEHKAEPYTATEGWRRLHAYHWLLSLAQRAFYDHWYEENEKTPYYPGPAKAFAKAAEKLAQGKTQTNQEVKLNEQRILEAQQAAKELAQVAPLKVTPLTNALAWTTEWEQKLQWRVEADAKLPPGIPMTELRVEDATRPRQPLAELWPDGKLPQAFTFPLPMTIKDKPEINKSARLRLNVWYRGQQQSEEIEVTSYAANLVINRSTSQHVPHVAVRMEKDLKFGALSIMLDRSGSMGWIHKDDNGNVVNKQLNGDPKKKNRRYDYAVKALDSLLQQMPELQHLSVVNFVNSEIKVLRGPDQPWNAGGIRESLIERLQQYGEGVSADGKIFEGLNGSSPIALGIKRCMEEGFPKNYDGPKVVLALTDGADTWSFGSSGLDPNQYTRPELVQDLLTKELRKAHPGVTVVTVCFVQQDPKEKDYEYALKQFKEPNVRRDRVFRTVEDGDTLGGVIKDLLRPRVQFTALNIGKEEKELDINQNDGQFKWVPVNAAEYQLGAGDNGFGKFSFNPGQNVLMMLRRSDKYFLESGLVANQGETRKRLDANLIKLEKDWFATLYESERYKGNLKQLLFLEKIPSKDSTSLQPRPKMVWLDVPMTKDKDVIEPVRWRDDWASAAPAYRLTGPWLDDRPVELTATWQEDFPSHSAFCVRWSPTDSNRKFKVGKTTCEIESFGPEPMPGKEGECFVVRVRHDLDNPVYLRLDRWGAKNQATVETGGWRADHEHQYFSRVGKYTVRFYPWQGFDHNKAEFQVLCINSFKSDAERRQVKFEPTVDVRMPALDFFHGSKLAEKNSE